MGRKLYVGNLPYDTAEDQLQSLFAQAGSVESVKVMRDMATGRARGFAFVDGSTTTVRYMTQAELTAYLLRRLDHRLLALVVPALG